MPRERIKSFILVGLLIISVFQVGILWSGSDNSSPFYFAAKVFNMPQENTNPEVDETDYAFDTDAKQIILNPFRVTLCDGEAHYVVPRNSDEFTILKETSFLLYEDTLGERMIRKDISVETWNSLMSKQSILFEFKTPITREVIMWSTGFYNVSSGAPEDVQKLLVIPREGATVGLYVLTSTGAIQYVAKSVSISVMEKMYSETLSVIDVDNSSTIKFATISEFGANSYPEFRGDVMGNIYGRESVTFRSLLYTVPFFVRSAEFTHSILGDEINSYSRSNEADNNIMIFKNYSNVYRFNSDGIMEYSYIPSVLAQDKGDMFAALSNVMTFVQRIKNDLLVEPELYLSGMSQDETSYQFTFDYIFKDTPVFIRHELKQMEETIIQENAVVIRASSKRTITCRWALVDMFFSVDEKDMLSAFDTIDVTNISKMAVNDISFVYYFDMNINKDHNDTARPVWPEWRIEAPDGSAVFVPMKESMRVSSNG